MAQYVRISSGQLQTAQLLAEVDVMSRPVAITGAGEPL